MAVTFRLSGTRELIKSFEKLERDVDRVVRRAITDTVLGAEAEIVSKFEAGIYDKPPVDTGRLKGSITAKTAFESGDSATEIAVDGLSAVVGTNVAYAIPIHDGSFRRLKHRQTRQRRSRGTTAVHRGEAIDTDTGEAFSFRAVRARPFIGDSLPAIRAILAGAIEDELTVI